MNAAATSTVAVPPTVRVCAASAPAAWGAAALTVTAKVWAALPAALVAVTVTVAVPAVTPLSVRTGPFTLVVTTDVSLLVAV